MSVQEAKKFKIDSTINFALLLTLLTLVVGSIWWGAWYVSEEHNARVLDHDKIMVLEQTTRQFMEQVYKLQAQVAGVDMKTSENGVVLNRLAVSIANHIDRDRR